MYWPGLDLTSPVKKKERVRHCSSIAWLSEGNKSQYLQRAFPMGVENHGIKVSIRKKLLPILLVLLVFLME